MVKNIVGTNVQTKGEVRKHLPERYLPEERCQCKDPIYKTARTRFWLMLVAGLLTATTSMNASAYLITFNDPLDKLSSYSTSTGGVGEDGRKVKYKAFINGKTVDYEVGPLTDFNKAPKLLTDLTHPIIGDPINPKAKDPGKLFTCCTPLAVVAGKEVGDSTARLGTGTHQYNIGGTFRVVPEPGEPTSGFVNLKAKGMIDGFVAAVPKSGATPPKATFNAQIFIEKLGTVSVSSNTTGTITETVGLTGTIAKEPGVTGGVSSSSQVSIAGTGPQNFSLLGKVPVNEDLDWNFIMTLHATNSENFFGGNSAAASFLTIQKVGLTPQGRHKLKREDPFFSESVFDFDISTGELSILHPLAALGEVTPGIASDGTITETTQAVDYSDFLPEVESILTNDDFSTSDELLGSLIRYSGIFLDFVDSSGRFHFTDGMIEFFDPVSLDLLAASSLVDIIADPTSEMFSTVIENFELSGLVTGESALADEFVTHGGDMWFDPNIMSVTNLFTESGRTEGAYTVDGAASVPEPTTIALLILGLAGWRISALRKATV